MLADVTCCFGSWPFADLRLQQSADYEAHLADHGIDRALVTSLAAVLGPDPDLANRELFSALQGASRVIPVPTVDPSMRHWKCCLEEYREQGHTAAICLVPNYHRYTLEDDAPNQLAQELSSTGGCLLLQVRIEDERGQYPLMKVPGVPVDQIVAFGARHPDVPIICRCCYLKEVRQLAEATPNLHVDISYVEFLDTLKALLASFPAERVLFGSHTPMFYTQPALMKLADGDVSDAALDAITWTNAARIIPGLQKGQPS